MDQAILDRPPHGVTKRLNAEKAAQPSKPTEAEKAASGLIQVMGCKVYALDDLARRFHRTPFAYLSMCNLIESVADSLRSNLDAARALLPKKHPAIAYITKSGNDLDTMDKVIYEFYDGEDHATLPLKTIGEIMRKFVVDAAQAIERAGIACGDSSLCVMGYLDDPDLDPARIPRKKK